MGDEKRAKRGKKGGLKGATERRYEPVVGATATATLAAGAIGAALLGAGVYAQWVRAEPHRFGSYIVGAGALVLAAVIVLAPEPPRPLRVGDGGVAVEDDADAPTRLLWCDVERVSFASGAVVVEGRSIKISAPVAAHGQAAARIVREARGRVPDRVEIAPDDEARLPAVDPAAGQQLDLEPPQVAGRRCAASDRLISYEPDARLCLRCLACYHREAAPPRCKICDAELASPS